MERSQSSDIESGPTAFHTFGTMELRRKWGAGRGWCAIRGRSMRGWGIFLAVLASGLFAYGMQPVTVQQLQAILIQAREAHNSDAQMARKLMAVRLVERLNEPTEEQLEAKLRLGVKTLAALEMQADLSTFLELPADELPHKDTPSMEEQRKMLQALVTFATVTLKHMPNFLAVRTTRTFADFPIVLQEGVFQSGLHSMGKTVQETGYRNGQEVVGKLSKSTGRVVNKPMQQPGLTSSGEFGQDLGIMLADSLRGKITWSHWEQTPEGLAAVFHYEVTKEGSHYKLYFCCGWNSAEHAETAFNGTPAYHGSFAVDPVSGAILRTTLQADFEGFDPRPQCNIAVEYGPVEVEGVRSILPMRSVAIGDGTTMAMNQRWINLYINEVRFSNYQRFGSTMKILTSPAEP